MNSGFLGRIIFGYPAIGKSSCATFVRRTIDLESSAFTCNGKKPEGWEDIYATVAINLANQGYDVFVSTHPDAIKAIATRYGHVMAIFPSLDIEGPWIDRLKTRVTNTEIEYGDATEYFKNQRACDRAEKHYEEDISALEHLCETLRIPYIALPTTNYDLNDVVCAMSAAICKVSEKSSIG